jgi:energy-coupling factor transporter ATP-binding protein EcfA2
VSRAPIIRRVTGLRIEDFRGFRGQHDIGLDADVVVLSGSNGFGKSSLLDALNVVLNGGEGSLGGFPYRQYFVHDGREEAHLIAHAVTDAGMRSLRADVRRRTPKKKESDVIDVAWAIAADGTSPAGEPRPAAAMGSTVAALATAFFEDVSELDWKEAGNLLWGQFAEYAPVRARLEEVAQALAARGASVQDARVEPATAIEAARREAAVALRDAWAAGPADLPRREADLFLIENDNLRPTWASELRNLANALAAEPAARLEESDSADNALRSIERQLEARVGAERQRIATTGSRDERLQHLALELGRGPTPGDAVVPRVEAASVPDDEVTLPLTEAAEGAVAQRLAVAGADLGQREARIKAIRGTLTRYRGMEPRLESVLDALLDGAESWAAPPGGLPDGLVDGYPAELATWLGSAAPGGVVADLRERLGAWLDALGTALQDEEAERQRRERWVREQQRIARIGGALRALERPDLVESLVSGGELPAARLAERVAEAAGRQHASPQDGAVLDALERLLAATRQWLRVEGRAVNRERLLRETPALEAGKRVLEEAQASLDYVLGMKRGKGRAGGVLQDSVRIPESVQKGLEQAFHGILDRFRLVADRRHPKLNLDVGFTGKEPVRPSMAVRVPGGSDPATSRDVLSTGQRTQYALSFTLALNLVFEPLLGHRAILLDDVSTALDVAQLPRIALLLRQLAYTGDDASRRQIFIASHHEDLTDRLLDFLLPPPGRRLLLVQFDGWSAERGPSMKFFETTGAPRPEGFAADFGELFTSGLQMLRDPFGTPRTRDRRSAEALAGD